MIAGVLIVCAGIVMSGPGVPGPGIVTILIGLGFLALEFDRAERLMERGIIWGDRAADRAENTTKGQRIAAGIVTALVAAAFVAAAILWDIPLVPVLEPGWAVPVADIATKAAHPAARPARRAQQPSRSGGSVD